MARTRRNRWWTDDDRDRSPYGRSRRSARRERRLAVKAGRLEAREDARRRVQDAVELRDA